MVGVTTEASWDFLNVNCRQEQHGRSQLCNWKVGDKKISLSEYKLTLPLSMQAVHPVFH
ncbi:hypothetical protein VP01_14286g1, partial [Puccinia sorghi]